MSENYNFLDFIEIGTSFFDTEIQKKMYINRTN